TPGGRGSTFLDLTVDPPALLREGAIQGTAIRAALKK
ncbi:MAG TPA: threonylcarbamoyl-AMP synthase, partial [Syntrophus sp. (in: bacteria)]|nr:threonylcarbamoyl-AMP synthase [Syntrophus sp. (in: bacteria)]